MIQQQLQPNVENVQTNVDLQPDTDHTKRLNFNIEKVVHFNERNFGDIPNIDFYPIDNENCRINVQQKLGITIHPKEFYENNIKNKFHVDININSFYNSRLWMINYDFCKLTTIDDYFNINCTNCINSFCCYSSINCTNCFNCDYCTDCNKCFNCNSCKNARECINCVDCKNIIHCSKCLLLIQCESCHNSKCLFSKKCQINVYPKHLDDEWIVMDIGRYIHNHPNAKIDSDFNIDCEECENCKCCVNSKKCKDCSGVINCTNCIDCTKCFNCTNCKGYYYYCQD